MKKNILSIFIFSVYFNCSAQGASITFEQNPKLPIVNISLAFRAGSSSDPAGLPGLTNFMGEMLTRGTRLRNKTQFETRLDDLGSALAIDTRAELLIIRGSVLAENLDGFFELIQELLLEPRFEENEINKLRSEMITGLLNEKNNDSSLATISFDHFMLEGHPYGHPVMGTIAGMKRISKKDVLQQYKTVMRGGELIAVGTGDAAPLKIKQWVNQLVSRLPAGSPRIKIEKPLNPDHTRVLIVDKPDRSQIPVIVGHVGVKMNDPKYLAFYVGNNGFGGSSLSSRLMKEIRAKRGWAYGAYSTVQSATQPKQWSVRYSPAKKDLEPSLAHTLHMIRELHEKGLTAEEFNFSQNSLARSAGFMFNTPIKRVENALIEEALDLPKGFFSTFEQRISALTHEQVNEALREFTFPDQLAIVTVGPAEEIKPLVAEATGVEQGRVQVRSYTEEN